MTESSRLFSLHSSQCGVGVGVGVKRPCLSPHHVVAGLQRRASERQAWWRRSRQGVCGLGGCQAPHRHQPAHAAKCPSHGLCRPAVSPHRCTLLEVWYPNLPTGADARLSQAERELAQFEAAMALTNIAALGDAAKRRIVQERGLRKLEYLQFSENLQVRRAATEAISNMVPNPDAVRVGRGTCLVDVVTAEVRAR